MHDAMDGHVPAFARHPDCERSERTATPARTASAKREQSRLQRRPFIESGGTGFRFSPE
jgi:hypothetical protein